MSIVIVKRDGTATQPMTQDRAMAYLTPVVGTDQPKRLSNLQSNLNDVVNGKGKATTGTGARNTAAPHFTFRSHKVLHCSSGKLGTSDSTTVFFFLQGGHSHVIAIGRHDDDHKGKPAYAIDIYGQTGDPNFNSNCVLRLANKPK